MNTRRISFPILLGASLLAGCTSTETPSTYQITRTTTDQTVLGAKRRGAVGAIVEWDGPSATVDLNALVERVKIVARHEATLRQREVARKRAAAAVRHLPAAKKQAMKSHAVRYLAVETERNAESRGKKSVMLWDVTTSNLVSHDVYDIAETPTLGAHCAFDTYSAAYVGTGL